MSFEYEKYVIHVIFYGTAYIGIVANVFNVATTPGPFLSGVGKGVKGLLLEGVLFYS